MAKKAAKKKAAPAKAGKAKGDVKVKGKPRAKQMDLIEDAAIKPLEDIAARYADIRDQRIELNREESSLKSLAKSTMHQYGKTHYKRNGIEISLLPGEEDIKVKVAKPDNDDAEAED